MNIEWVAGFYEAEGHYAKDKERLTIQNTNLPCLEQVRRIVNGNIRGPYTYKTRPKNKPFYTWDIAVNDGLNLIPYSFSRRTKQITGQSIVRTNMSMSFAGGLFSGEGNFTVNNSASGPCLEMQLKMTDENVVWAFADCVRIGQIHEVDEQKYHPSAFYCKRAYQWRIGTKNTIRALTVLWPYLSEEKQGSFRTNLVKYQSICETRNKANGLRKRPSDRYIPKLEQFTI